MTALKPMKRWRVVLIGSGVTTTSYDYMTHPLLMYPAAGQRGTFSCSVPLIFNRGEITIYSVQCLFLWLFLSVLRLFFSSWALLRQATI